MSGARKGVGEAEKAEALRIALRELGVEGTVEMHDRLAVLTLAPSGDVATLVDGETRRQAVALAKAHGFTNLALEIGPTTTRAPLSRD
jgi:hypothetical protein